jgi:Fic family protein
MDNRLVIIPYELPDNWIRYDATKLIRELTEANGAVLALKSLPYQRSWAEKLQYIQLKREVEGTSRIEGADFTEGELEDALKESPEELFSRSQRQARAALLTYQWIAQLEDDRPINGELILEIHRRIITGADDDHCPPGRIRGEGHNVSFGSPRHKGCDGGQECDHAFELLDHALQREFKDHDPMIQALAVHYHFAAIHPFLDGNGRTARALEALILQRAGLRDTLFVAMSNYYYDNKADYLAAMSQTRASHHDLTIFLKFGLKGITVQCKRLFAEIKRHLSKALFRNVMFDLFNRLLNTRKRVIAERQIEILQFLLDAPSDVSLFELIKRTDKSYQTLGNPLKALFRDLDNLIALGAVIETEDLSSQAKYFYRVNLEWPTKITETEFFKVVSQLPKAKSHRFLTT